MVRGVWLSTRVFVVGDTPKTGLDIFGSILADESVTSSRRSAEDPGL